MNCQNSAKWSCVCVATTNLGSTVSIQELSGASCTSPTLHMATHTDQRQLLQSITVLLGE